MYLCCDETVPNRATHLDVFSYVPGKVSIVVRPELLLRAHVGHASLPSNYPATYTSLYTLLFCHDLDKCCVHVSA